MDNVHVGDVAKYSFFDQVTLQAKVKEDSGAVSWLEPMMVRFPMWMKGHAIGRDPAAVFIGGTLYQIKGDSHSYVQTWRVHGGQLKQAKRAQWSGVAGYLPITDAAVVAEVEGAMERWKLLLAGKVGGKRDTGTGGDEEGYDTDQSRHGARNFPKVCRAINAYGRARLPSWFTWTAVQVNHGISPSSTMPGHKHQDHLPLSAIVTVGDFSGGEFCVEEAGLVFPTKGTRPCTMACVAGPEGQDRVDEDGVALDARNGVVFCSGALHMPAPWRGERYALVFFTQVGLGKVSWEDLVLLRSLGFRLCAG